MTSHAKTCHRCKRPVYFQKLWSSQPLDRVGRHLAPDGRGFLRRVFCYEKHVCQLTEEIPQGASCSGH